MLANMKVGTKLAAILLAPLAVLGVLAGLGIADRANTAADLRTAQREATLTARNDELQHALQVEQLWAATVLGNPSVVNVGRFQDATAASTEAAKGLNGAIKSLGGEVSTEVSDRVTTVADRLSGLDGLRPTIESGSATASATLNRYAQVFDSLLGLQEVTTGNQPVSDLAQDLGYTTALSKAKSAQADQDAALVALASAPTGDERTTLLAAVNDFKALNQRYLAQFFEEADPDFRALLRNAQATTEAREADALGAQIIAGQGQGTVQLTDAAIVRLNGYLGVQSDISRHILDEADSERQDATRTAQLYLAGALVGIIAAVGVAFLVARSITRPLRRLTAAADMLATEQLPTLVSQLRSGSAEANIEYHPIEIGSRDELGQLARAFNSVQQVTVDVAHEQGTLLRKGISDIFVNLARRNQSLLDRQIEFIDQLEANERDPDQLENLFRLDHLATRMRRNAESLLVLAGADPSRRRGRPVALADVVRVAVGEVADYSRVRVRELDEVTVSSAAAVDTAHLLAELMENSTQFSPPNTVVEVSGRPDGRGGYELTVVDHGIGISGEHLRDFNELLANPPVMGLDMSRSLGFVVIGRLAQRHGVAVRLASPPDGGVVATVSLPQAVLGSVPGSPSSADGAERGELPTRRAAVAAAPLTDETPPIVAAPYEPPTPTPTPVSDFPAPPPSAVPTAPMAPMPVAAAPTESLFVVGADGNGSSNGNGASHGNRVPNGVADGNGHGSVPTAREQAWAVDAPAPEVVTPVRHELVGALPDAPQPAEQAESFTYYDVEEDFTSLLDDSAAPAVVPATPIAPMAPVAPIEPEVPLERSPVAPLAGVTAPDLAPVTRLHRDRPADVTDVEAEDTSFVGGGFPPLVLPQRRSGALSGSGPATSEPPTPVSASQPVEDVAPAMVGATVPEATVDESTVDEPAVDEPAVVEDAVVAPSAVPSAIETVEAPTVERPSLFSSEAMSRPQPDLEPNAAALSTNIEPTSEPIAEPTVEAAAEQAEPALASGLPSRRPTSVASPSADDADAIDEPNVDDAALPDAAVARSDSVGADLPTRSVPQHAAAEALPSRRLGADPLPARPSAGIASRPAAGIATPLNREATVEAAGAGEGLTAAGLVRRSPKQQLRAMARGDAEQTMGNRAAASQRSPEEVRKMLSRYRSGLQRGRVGAAPTTGDDGSPRPGTAPSNGVEPDQAELATAHEHAAEELPWRP